MKKIIITLSLLAITTVSFSQQPKTYKVQADVNTWQAIIVMLDKSNAPHTDVELAKKILVEQITAQLKAEQDTTGKTAKKK